MNTDTNDKMLERVRALLAKADSTTFPAEADAFRAKADALMAQYAIQQWQVNRAQEGIGQVAKPERVDLDFGWWYGNNPRHDELWNLYHECAYHCRVVIALRGIGSGGRRTMPIIGLASDIAYFDMLFTHLMLQMGKGLEPKPDPAKSEVENIVVLKEAGLKWDRIGELMTEAGLLTIPYKRSVGGRWVQMYNRYCVENNKPRINVAPSVYQRSFAEGFVAEIGERFHDMRKYRQFRNAVHESNALAIRDMRSQAVDLYAELFPPLAPSGKKSTGYVSRNLAHSSAAQQEGRKAGRNADIRGTPQRGLRNQKELKS